jgi:uncharacterized protein YeaC (DUF1315 family)
MTDAYRQLLEQMDRALYDRLLDALATGRWPDGRTLTGTQRESAMRAVIAWGELHLPVQERVGFIDKGHKAESQCDAVEPLSWKEPS